MSSDALAVLRDALALPEDERAGLAAELFASLHGPDNEYSPEAAQAWAREIERRIERITAGESSGEDLETARRRLEAELADR